MEIPVKKNSGSLWWLWLAVALTLIALFLWWVLAAGRNEELSEAMDDAPAILATAPPMLEPVAGDPASSTNVATPASPTNMGAPPVIDGDPGLITDLATVMNAEDPTDLVGREFQLTGVRVLRVVGDRTFWVGNGPERQVFAALREVPPPGWPTDADININPRQTISMSGVVRRPGENAFGGRPLQDMPPGTPIVLHAERAEVLTRP